MKKVIHLTRHAQAYHNVDEDYSIPDPELTPLGRRQAEALYTQTTEIQESADLLVSSALKRTLQTTIIGYRDLRKRLGGRLLVLSRLQEANDFPCDTGSSREELESINEFQGIDFGSLESDWNSKKGEFSPDFKAVSARARWVRRWLRDRPEQNIVVVAHGDIIRVMANVGDWWANCEVRKYTFAHDDDEEAELVELLESAEARTGGYEPTSGQMAKS